MLYVILKTAILRVSVAVISTGSRRYAGSDALIASPPLISALGSRFSVWSGSDATVRTR